MRVWLALAVPLGLILSFSNPDKAPKKNAAGIRTSGTLSTAIDQSLAAVWETEGVTPAEPVDDLQLARRLWVDLLGTIPSLEELRALEGMPVEGRRQALVDRVMADPRFAEVLAERLARIAVGADAKPDDLIYRRRRLVTWLTVQVKANRPWDELVRDLLTEQGSTTDKPATNFVRSQDADPIKLAARTTRAFLGVRIDCAQCHDHPFARWKQADFEGLSAFFARIEEDLAGVHEGQSGEYELEIVERKPGETADALGKIMSVGADSVPKRVVPPRVPYGQGFFEERTVSTQGRRAALADWVTHDANEYFAKALVNRLWHWLMGRGIVEPVDELESTKPRSRELLELLAQDFSANGYDVQRTIRAIVSSQAYAIGSRVADGVDEEAAVDSWAAYPLKPLRGDQLGRAILQAGSLWTYDEGRHPLFRLMHFGRTGEFTKRHGDDLSSEDAEEETLLMRLHLLNGEVLSETTKDDNGLGPVVRLPQLSPSPEAAVDDAFLMVLTRRPSARERELFVGRLSACVTVDGKPDSNAQAKVMSDLFWALMNTTEFAWSH